MSADMYPDAAIEYIIHMADPVSSPDGKFKMFVLADQGPLYEVYGWESDVAAMADLYPEGIYFWAEGDAEDFAPELSLEQTFSIVHMLGIRVSGATSVANGGANPVTLSDTGAFVTDVVRPFPGVETDDTLVPATSMGVR